MINKWIVFLLVSALLINSCTLIPATQQESTITPMPAATSTETTSYTSERFGVSFDLPSGWEKVGEDHFVGPDGFVQIEHFESIANTTLRVCDWEMNLHPQRYGNRPRADIVVSEPFIEQPPCKIIPSADAADQSFHIFFKPSNHYEERGYAVLRYDPDEGQVIESTLDLHTHMEQYEEHYYPGKDIEATGPEDQEVNGLTLRIWSTSYNEANEIRGRIDAQYPKQFEGVEDWNKVIASYGYRIEILDSGKVNIYQGEKLFREGLETYPFPMVKSQNDFALILMENYSCVLFRKSGITPYNCDQHYWANPVFVRDQLVTLEQDYADGGRRALIRIDGEPVFSYASALPDSEIPMAGELAEWQGKWLFIANNTLIVDGEIMNPQLGYGEIFDWQLYYGKPVFFFERGGRYGLSYDGVELPITWEYIFHIGCCGYQIGPFQYGFGTENRVLVFTAWEDGVYKTIEVNPVPECTPTNRTETLSEELKKARNTLTTFFELLHQREYEKAAMIYGGDYQGLRDSNPLLDPQDHVALLTNGCEINGLQCLLVKRIFDEKAVSSAEYQFTVEFLNQDGSLFVRGPCCGGNATDFPPESQFHYTVIRNCAGEFLVLELPIYVP
jgi:hypothetical protein